MATATGNLDPVRAELDRLNWSPSDLHREINTIRKSRRLKPITYATVHAWTKYDRRPDPVNLDILASLLPLTGDDVAAIQRIKVDPSSASATAKPEE